MDGRGSTGCGLVTLDLSLRKRSRCPRLLEDEGGLRQVDGRLGMVGSINIGTSRTGGAASDFATKTRGSACEGKGGPVGVG